jgi:hypothetical protein
MCGMCNETVSIDPAEIAFEGDDPLGQHLLSLNQKLVKALRMTADKFYINTSMLFPR